MKRELKEKEELVKLLKLDILDMRETTIRQVEEISQELENARKEAEYARNDADIAQVQLPLLLKPPTLSLTKKKVMYVSVCTV